MNLKELQKLLYQHISDPDRTKERLGDELWRAPGVVEGLVHGDERLTAAERIGIYADAYFYRLLECLGEDFPATLTVIGAENFAALVKGYLLQYPPIDPSILYAGLYLADFLYDHPVAKRWPFIAELARLERTVLDVFHAADAPVLGVEALRAVPSDGWPAVKLRTHPAVEIVHSEWRIADLVDSVEHGQEWKDPEHEKASVLVWRQNTLVYYRNLEPMERDALVAITEGASFAGFCETVAAGAEEANHVALIARLMARWLADGIIVAPDAMLVTTHCEGKTP